MYGLVNKAVKDMICKNFGESTWQQIRQRAGIEVDEFVRMDAYDDAITYQLVEAASELLKMPAADILQAFGEHWVVYTAKEGYGELIEANGRNLSEFLLNLENLHARIGLVYADLKPPHFHCWQDTDSSIVVEYYSEREGLAPMMIGLLKGVARVYATPVTIVQTGTKQQDEKDSFRVEIH